MPLMSMCRTSICGPAPILPFGYGGGGGGGSSVRGIQAALVIQRMRLLCCVADASQNSTISVKAIESDASCCDGATTPTQLSVSLEDSDNINPFLPGAAIGNAVAAIGAFRAVCHLLLNIIMRPQEPSTRTRKRIARTRSKEEHGTLVRLVLSFRTLFDCWHVALVWPGYSLLFTSTVGVAIPLLFGSRSSSSSIALGASAFLLWIAPWAIDVLLGRSIVILSEMRRRRIAGQQSRIRRFSAYLLDPTEKFVTRDSPHLASELLRNYGPVFSRYRASRLWYFNVELAISLVTGILMGLSYSLQPCAINTIGWGLAGIGVLECVAVAALRPFSTRIDMFSIFLIDGLMVVSQVIALVDISDAAQEASQVIGIAASIFQLAIVVMLAVTEVVLSSST